MTVALANERAAQNALPGVPRGEIGCRVMHFDASAAVSLVESDAASFQQRWVQAVQTTETDHQIIDDAVKQLPPDDASTILSSRETALRHSSSQSEGNLVSVPKDTGNNLARPGRELSTTTKARSMEEAAATSARVSPPAGISSRLRERHPVKSNKADEKPEKDRQGSIDEGCIRSCAAPMGEAAPIAAKYFATLKSAGFEFGAAAKNGPEGESFTSRQGAQLDGHPPARGQAAAAGEVYATVAAHGDVLQQNAFISELPAMGKYSTSSTEANLDSPPARLHLSQPFKTSDVPEGGVVFQAGNSDAAQARRSESVSAKKASAAGEIADFAQHIPPSEQSLHTTPMAPQVSNGARQLGIETLKPVGSSSEQSLVDPFTAIDRHGAVQATSWVHAGAQHAETGFADPTLGWIAVRAELHGESVHAAIVASSAEGASALHGQLAGLDQHLAERQIPVESLTVTADRGQGGAPNDARGQEQERNSHQAAGSASMPPIPALGSMAGNLMPPADVSVLSAQASPGLGIHISVCV